VYALVRFTECACGLANTAWFRRGSVCSQGAPLRLTRRLSKTTRLTSNLTVSTGTSVHTRLRSRECAYRLMKTGWFRGESTCSQGAPLRLTRRLSKASRLTSNLTIGDRAAGSAGPPNSARPKKSQRVSAAQRLSASVVLSGSAPQRLSASAAQRPQRLNGRSGTASAMAAARLWPDPNARRPCRRQTARCRTTSSNSTGRAGAGRRSCAARSR
jgi:hypothetical protein